MSSAVQLLIFYHDTYIQSKKRNDHVTIELFILLGSKFQFHQWHTVSTPFQRSLMALFPLTRILRKTTNHSQLVLSLLLQFSTQSYSLSTPKLFSFTSAFHQTFSKQSRLSHFTSHFSTLQSFPTRILTDPFAFSPPSTHARDPREQILLDSIKRVAHFDSETQAMASLDEAGVEADVNLVYSVIWALREEWRLAFLAFKLGERQGSLDEKVSELMVWVLGNCKKFNIAWCLIRDMYKSSFSTRRAMLVMIERWSAALLLLGLNLI